MEVDEETPITDNSRIEDCEVCGKNKAKYTCPRCEVRTCCLDCVKIHKKELECNGIRDRVKFKTLKNFSNIDLLNDYRFLEETARLVSRSEKLPPKSCYNPINGNLPLELYRLMRAALSRGVQLHYLPPAFERHRTNTTHLDYNHQNLYWKIDWVFPQAENFKATDKRVLDSLLLSACVHKYIVPEDMTFPQLSFYQAAGHSGITLLLQAERTAPNRYHMLDSTSTIRVNLFGKSIIENPVIYVVLNHHRHLYNVLTDEEEEELQRKQKRRLNDKRKRSSFGPNNFLFSDINNEEGNTMDKECCSEGDDQPNEGETGDTGRPFRKHPKFSRGRGRGRRRGHFRGRWNGGRNRRGHRGKPQHSCGESSQEDVNGGLSQSLGAIAIQQ
ncbi:box C/D snoRNA protein 1 [Macrosteles quadrilineatus]|uniref:box C/D snoRNA protein 1 n=1 Tax=Macrosteles quadrilineatus TaxID=74068 RepID=UPI0023E1831F|nr:box C/D snoRNA protein 1 [Macrosteles quadrilineatus]